MRGKKPQVVPMIGITRSPGTSSNGFTFLLILTGVKWVVFEIEGSFMVKGR